MSFELDYFCNSLSFKVDMFTSCEQAKGSVLMRQKQGIFSNGGIQSWFATKYLQHEAITMSTDY